jgi:hypothetical protein
MLIYNEPTFITKNKAEKIFSQDNLNAIKNALVSIAFYEKDWRWCQNICLNFLDHPDNEVKNVAITCLGHIARIHNKLDRDLVVSKLEQLLKNDALSSRIEDALSDIEIFLG